MSYKDNKASLEEIIKLLPEAQGEQLMSFINICGIKPRWYATNSFNTKYRNEILYRFRIENDDHYYLNITLCKPVSELDGILLSLSKAQRDFYFKHIRRCRHCNPSHGNGKQINILGELYHICAEPEAEATDPSKEELKLFAELVEARKAHINSLIV